MSAASSPPPDPTSNEPNDTPRRRGRPPKYPGGTNRIMLSLSVDSIAWLREQENFSDVVEELIRKEQKRLERRAEREQEKGRTKEK